MVLMVARIVLEHLLLDLNCRRLQAHDSILDAADTFAAQIDLPGFLKVVLKSVRPDLRASGSPGIHAGLGPRYDSDLDMNNDRLTIADKLTSQLSNRLRELHAPLELQGVTISNIAPDPTVQNARNVALTTASVNQVAASLTANYVKLEGIRAQERMVNVLAQSRTPVTIIFGV